MHKIKRKYCSGCKYPLKTCICSSIKHITIPAKITIIQHQKEANHAKNTVRLAKLICPQINVILYNDIDELDRLKNELVNNKAWLVYPNNESKAIEDLEVQSKNTINHLLYLDGSWPQVYGMYKSLEWLQGMSSIHFKTPPQQQYEIRSSKKTTQLSTIESIAYGIQKLYSIDTQAFIRVLQSMQQHWVQRN